MITQRIDEYNQDAEADIKIVTTIHALKKDRMKMRYKSKNLVLVMKYQRMGKAELIHNV